MTLGQIGARTVEISHRLGHAGLCRVLDHGEVGVDCRE